MRPYNHWDKSSLNRWRWRHHIPGKRFVECLIKKPISILMKIVSTDFPHRICINLHRGSEDMTVLDPCIYSGLLYLFFCLLLPKTWHLSLFFSRHLWNGNKLLSYRIFREWISYIMNLCFWNDFIKLQYIWWCWSSKICQ